MAIPRWARPAVWVVLAFAGTEAFAMGIHTSKRLLARSERGEALWEVREDGPEGGGALTYRIKGKARGEVLDYPVSSDFSPGDGSQPQRVSAKECKQRMAALGTELAKRKIAGVTLHPERCDNADRAAMVVVGAEPS